MDESRFTRLELRVDEIKDDVSELKASDKVQQDTLKEIRSDIKSYSVDVKSHVAGDEKIITELTPLLKMLPEIVEQHSFQKRLKQEKDERIKYWATRLGLVSLSIGIISWFLSTF